MFVNENFISLKFSSSRDEFIFRIQLRCKLIFSSLAHFRFMRDLILFTYTAGTMKTSKGTIGNLRLE